jgi:membrane protein DedA with SNARE-associated domain
MNFVHFLAAIFLGRFVRFGVLSILVLWFGPQIVGMAGGLFRRHFYWVLAVVVIAGLVWWLLWRGKQSKTKTADPLGQ